MATRPATSASRPATSCGAPLNAAPWTSFIVFGTNGRVYSVAVATLPGGRGDGQPINTLIDLEAGSHHRQLLCRPRSAATC